MDSVASRSRSNSGLNFLSLLEKSYRAPPGSDYWVTTMQLRERVRSVKTPQRRTGKASIKSAPPFQNRNPDNYPMQHNREDVLKSAKSRRTEKQVREKTNASSRVYSGNMRDYGKQMFDFAVISAKQNCSQDVRKTKELGTTNQSKPAKWAKPRRQNESCRPEQPDCRTNGPTPDGSILYNRRQKVLNTIRIRPKSESDGQYIHDRTTSRLSVNETIREKNQHYRVLNLNESLHPGTSSGRSTSCSTDVLLIPMEQINEKVDYLRERRLTDPINGHSVHTDDAFSELVKNESRASTCDPFDDRDTTDGRKSRDPCRLLPPNKACNVRLVSLEESSSSESEEEQEEAPPPPPPEPKKQEPKSPLKRNARMSIPEPEPEVKPVKLKLVLKGPKCWVDDATITSEVSDEELEEEVVEPAPPPPVLKGVLKGVLNMKQNVGVLAKLARSKESPSGNLKDLTKAIKGQGNTHANKEIPKPPPEPVEPEPVLPEPVMEETEPEEEKPACLPPFLCPSSEKKSREAAIKDWLMNSCFHSASSGVPLI